MFSKRYISIIFLTLLWTPFIIKTLNLSKPYEEESGENRALQKLPDVDIKKIDTFPSLYEKHFNDHFIYRSLMIDELHASKVKWFKQSPIPGVTIGKDKWLFYRDETKTFDREYQFTDEALKKFFDVYEKRRQFLEQQNCLLYLYIVPPKIMVYPEYSGEKTIHGNEPTQGTQIEAYFNKNSKIRTCYLLPTLLEGKKEEEEHSLLYRTTDNHWCDYGAYVAYKKMIQDLAKDFPGMKALNLEDIVEKDSLENGGNLAGMINMPDYFKEHVSEITIKHPQAQPDTSKRYTPPKDFGYPDQYERQFKNADSQLPRALFIRDSFTDNLMPFLSENFSHSTFIFDGWQYELNEDIVKSEKPQVMVYVILESMLWKYSK
jgi:hypothetical protein